MEIGVETDVEIGIETGIWWVWWPAWRSAFGGFGGVDMVAGFWVWWPAFGWLGCYGFARFVVGTWWVLFCFFFYFLFWVFGSGFRHLGRIWVVLGLALGGWI